MNEINIDMALEASEYHSARKGTIPSGIKVNSRDFGGIKYTDISVTDKEGSEYLGKPQGTYITFESEDLRGSVKESYKQNRKFISNEIRRLLLKNNITETDPILVVGLGNWDITPDALGPKTVSALFVSRHLFEHLPELTDSSMRPVSAISPGVLGTTGIETLEIIKGIVEKTSPACVIAIDALVARSLDRLGKSLQIADSGINPGSGVGNHRKGLNFDTLGVPVISIGVPTVVSALTIAESTGAGQNSPLPQGDLIVTPKDIDELISDLSEVIAAALNTSLHASDVSKLLQ